MKRFSGQDSPLFDFPVVNEKPVRFSGLKRFFGRAGLSLAFLYLVLCGILMGALFLGVLGGLLWGYWAMLMDYTGWTVLGTIVIIGLYIPCWRMARKEYDE